jgi:hypothetical protein
VVYARSVFDHSLNYRCAVVLGTTRRVDDADEKRAALEAVTEQLSPGSWSYARLPTKRELAATSVYALDLTEASVKVRTGPPHDEPEDVVAGGRWAGVLPVRTVFDAAQPAPDLEPGPALPAHVSDRRPT